MNRHASASGTALLVVSVKPGSRRPGISVTGEMVEVRVAAPARAGMANEAVRRSLADALRCARGAVSLVRGGSARRKSFAIGGMTLEEALARLTAPADR